MRAKGLLVIAICLITCQTALAQSSTISNSSAPHWDGVYRRLHVPILMYHYVSDVSAKDDKLRRSLTVTPAEFQAQMSYLSEQGYSTVSLYQLNAALLIGATLPSKPIILTFDDGYIDDYLNVFPVLKQYGFSGTFFIITGTADANNPGYLSWAEIRAMSDAGMDMEGHTRTHADLKGQSVSFVQDEVESSLQALAAHTGKMPHIFAYPSGEYDDTVLKVMRASDVWVAVTTRGADWETPDALLQLPRLRVDQRMGAKGLAELLAQH